MTSVGQKRPLALDYAPHGAAKGWRKDEHLIDALPYIDHVPPELKPHVEALIEEEKRRSTKLPSDYLRELPPVRAPQFDEHPVLKTEYERVRSKQPLAPLDTLRYRLDPPPQTKRGDVGSWRAAADNAAAQLEHQQLRILNQELLLKHGDRNWRAQVQLDEAAVKGLEGQLVALRRETDALNRERKLQQHAAGAELFKLERQYMAQLRKNWDIERACMRLEGEVEGLQAALDARIAADTQRAAPSEQAAANGDHAAAAPEAGQQAEGPEGPEAAAAGPMEVDEQGGQATAPEAGPGPEGGAEEAAAAAEGAAVPGPGAEGPGGAEPGPGATAPPPEGAAAPATEGAA